MNIPDLTETRDRLRAVFEYLEIPARVEVGTVGTDKRVVITPLSAADAEKLTTTLVASRTVTP